MCDWNVIFIPIVYTIQAYFFKDTALPKKKEGSGYDTKMPKMPEQVG